MMTEDVGASSLTEAELVRSEAASSAFWNRYFAATVETTRQRAPRLPYIPALDGIRAVAVIAVLLYHANVGWIPGGFLGVEIFFVLSGYLITSLLLAEWRTSGRVDLKAFWLRRARRLLPALFLLIAVTLTYAVVMMPQQVAQLRSDAAAAIVYVMNWWLIFDHKSYFEAMGRPSLLKHLWSLAVEEQFYLIWPPLFVLGVSRIKERWLTLMVIGGALASSVVMTILFQPGVDPSRLYYGTDTRAAELLIGAALAFIWRPGSSTPWSVKYGVRLQEWLATGQRGSLILEPVGVVGLSGIALALWRLGEYSPTLYRGGFLLVALATAVLIAAVVHPRSRVLSRVLGCAPLRWIGLRSYGIYLWHWPVYLITRPGLDVPLHGLSLMALRISLTLALVEFSYRCIEVPFRSGQVGRVWRTLRHDRDEQTRALRMGWLGVSGAFSLSIVILGIAVLRAKPAEAPPYLSRQEIHIVASPAAEVGPQTTISAVPTTQANVGGGGSSHVPTPEPIVAAPVSHAREVPAATPSNSPVTPTPDSGAVSTVPPTPEPTPTSTSVASYASTPAVTAIGDSVMLGASTQLVNDVPNLDLDAKVGLQVSDAIQILRARRDAGRLKQVVVLDIGNNGPMTSGEFDEIMHVVGSNRRVVFLNLRVPRSWEQSNNQVLASGVDRYPNASLLDWHRATVDHPELFWDDGIHLRPVGAQYYAMLVAHQISSIG